MEFFTACCMMFFSITAVGLMAFAVFAIGFLMGYKKEDKRIKTKNRNMDFDDEIKEEKAKKDWKRFLEYDGSIPYENV